MSAQLKNENGNKAQLILLSGLAADASVFAPQTRALPNLSVPDWPVPESCDTLDTYCQKLAEQLPQNRGDQPVVLGGASFGGLVSLHLAAHLKPRAVVLIGSVRGSSELPWLVRRCRVFKPFVRFIPVRVLKVICIPAASGFARKLAPNFSGIARQFRGSNALVLKWSLSRILDWDATPEVDCPIYQIHGDRDFVLPARHTTPDRLIRGGGHVISLSHPEQVSGFLRHVIDEVI